MMSLQSETGVETSQQVQIKNTYMKEATTS